MIDNYFPLGHLVTKSNKPPQKLSLLLASNQKPEDFIPVGMFNGSHLMWKPLPSGLGYVVSKNKPSVNKIRIIDPELLNKSHLTNMFYESSKVDKGIEYTVSLEGSLFPIETTQPRVPYPTLETGFQKLISVSLVL